MNSANRMKVLRQRRAAGLSVLTVTVELNRLTEVLIDAGWLEAWDQDDQAAIGRAVERLLASLAVANDV